MGKQNYQLSRLLYFANFATLQFYNQTTEVLPYNSSTKKTSFVGDIFREIFELSRK